MRIIISKYIIHHFGGLVHVHVEGAVPIQHRQESDGGGDLAEEGLDFLLDLGLGFFCCFMLRLVGVGVLFVAC
jgi:hypothetical protein